MSKAKPSHPALIPCHQAGGQSTLAHQAEHWGQPGRSQQAADSSDDVSRLGMQASSSSGHQAAQ